MDTKMIDHWADQMVKPIKKSHSMGRLGHALLLYNHQNLPIEPILQRLMVILKLDNALDLTKIERFTQHPDVLNVLPHKNLIQRQTVAAVIQQLQLKPHYTNGNRLIVIQPADQMTIAASNLLLKTLEAPQPNTFFVLIATNSASLLPTIKSRTWQMTISAPLSMVAAMLEQHEGISNDQAEKYTQMAYGDWSLACELSEDEQIRAVREALHQLLNGQYDVVEFVQNNHVYATKLLQWLSSFLSDVYLQQLGGQAQSNQDCPNVRQHYATTIAPELIAHWYQVSIHKLKQLLQQSVNINIELLLQTVLSAIQQRKKIYANNTAKTTT